MAIQGATQLRARLNTARGVFKPAGREWADQVVVDVRRRLPARLAATVRRKNSSQRKATVVGSFVVRILDSGAKPHEIRPTRGQRLKFAKGGQTIYARKVYHPGIKGQHFSAAAAQRALDDTDLLNAVVRAWNEAA